MKASIHGGTVSAQGPGARILARLLSRWHQGFANAPSICFGLVFSIVVQPEETSGNLERLAKKGWHDVPASLRNAARAALLLPLLQGCSSLAQPQEDAPSAPDPGSNKVVAERLQSSFKDIASYDSFEISEFRWVHSIKGWSWLTCVRFRNLDRKLTYAVFLKADKVVHSRFAVESDGCGTQTYLPFEQMPNTAKPAGGYVLEPLH